MKTFYPEQHEGVYYRGKMKLGQIYDLKFLRFKFEEDEHVIVFESLLLKAPGTSSATAQVALSYQKP